MPEATADVFSKATWIQGFIQAVWGMPEDTISMQPVACAMIASSPMALQTQRTASASPQPWQDRCPEVKNSFRGMSRDA
jgi:hypothetical protein